MPQNKNDTVARCQLLLLHSCQTSNQLILKIQLVSCLTTDQQLPLPTWVMLGAENFIVKQASSHGQVVKAEDS
jgi:hypothetical protein